VTAGWLGGACALPGATDDAAPPGTWRLSPIAHYKAAAEKGHAIATEKLAEIENILESDSKMPTLRMLLRFGA
jgi:hypothetical protein